jgi:hypothetical protein
MLSCVSTKLIVVSPNKIMNEYYYIQHNGANLEMMVVVMMVEYG